MGLSESDLNGEVTSQRIKMIVNKLTVERCLKRMCDVSTCFHRSRSRIAGACSLIQRLDTDRGCKQNIHEKLFICIIIFISKFPNAMMTTNIVLSYKSLASLGKSILLTESVDCIVNIATNTNGQGKWCVSGFFI